MKHLVPFARMAALALLLPLAARAQTGVTIGATTAPDASAALDIISSSKGVLLPRVAAAAAISSPAAGLLVYQTGSPAGFYYNAGTAGTPSWQQLATAAGAASTASNGLTKTGQNVALGGSLTGATTIGLGSHNLLLSASTGRLGLGTSTPLSLLSLGQAAAQANTPGQALGELSFVGFNRSTTSAGILAQSPGWDDASHLLFKTSAGGANATERLRIEADGDVGIGTSTPTQRLDVEGGILARGNGLISNQGAHLQWNRSNGGGETWLLNQRGGGAGGLAFGASDNVSSGSNTITEWGRFDNNGHLRLGTSGTFVANTAGPALEWAGPSFNTDPVGLYRHNATAASTELRVVVGDDATTSGADADRFVVGTASAGLGQLTTGAFTPQLTVQGNGNVGIGTGLPGHKLEVNGNALINTAYDLLLRDTNAGLGWYGTGKLWNGVAGLDGPTLYGYSGGLLGTNQGGTRSTALMWNGSGQIGLGTTAPVASAQVEISSTTRGFLPPRLTAAQRDNIGSPAEGLTVFNLDTDRLNTWNGTAWTEYIAGTTAAPLAAVSYSYTGGVQTYTVPAGMTLLRVTAVGAAGGFNSSNSFAGGQGGSVTATIPVTPGEVLSIYVGGKGGDHTSGSVGAAAGYNGGGQGFARFSTGGGGATDIRRGNSLADRLVVAGAGGGSGSNARAGAGGNPGNAGNSFNGGGGGQGGTQAGGGAGGTGNWTGSPGTLGQGGNAAVTGPSSTDNGTGAGGGGYYGGGGGGLGPGGVGNGGGGGGSSWATPAATGVSYTTGGNTGHGSMTLVAMAQPAPAFDGGNLVNVAGTWSENGSNVYRNSGKVGIGTSSPSALLDVQGSGDVGNNDFAFFRNFGNSANSGFSGGNGNDVSIRASSAIMAAEFYATSDRRLKTVLGRSNNATDLALLNKLRITDYTMRDRAAFGDRTFKKVIAQEVEAVLPQAVTRQTGFLPDVYALATAVQPLGDSLLVITLPAGLPGAATAGQRLKLIGEAKQVLATVARPAAAGARMLTVRRAQALAGAEVFVYGLEHADVRAVDYEALSMLNVSATQELARQLAALQARAATADAQAAAAASELQAVKAQATQTTATLDSLAQRLRMLEASGGQASK
ncbi:glycine-rich protein [Hymenobacter sp. ASUV-10]|uniref:receptor protein-tyrosine kinase n=1 Tax=Hymenobacter aranciens TaxID=3063996 RepID=A0ABT9BHU0_9BACT|nr:glycine-rich protein [Hymenobacter sp. ASUV-10]MDO7877801.1 glycine-rich protein [Hymenobacter sp. ASUV-10]